MILAGELMGAGIGFFVSGEVSSLIDWRWSFYVMALPSLGLVWAIWRHLPEPERGGHAWLTSGRDDGAGSQDTEPAPSMQKTVKDAAVPPRRELILRQDPTRRSLWWAIGYLLRVPTYRLLIAASALAYYFFAGVRAFGMIFFTGHYGLPRAVVGALVFVVGLGAIAGVVFGGRFSERLRRRGWFNARILVPAAALFASVPLLAVGIWTRNPWLALLMMTIGAAALAAAVAPIDAARLDIVHPRLWGRGEAGRMALRSVLEGGAPLLFGYCSTLLGGGDRGLMWTFLIMLIPMLAASSLALPARRSYLRDVATAAASAAALQRRR